MSWYRVWTSVGSHEQERVVSAPSASEAIRVAEARIVHLGWARRHITESRAQNENDPHDEARIVNTVDGLNEIETRKP